MHSEYVGKFFCNMYSSTCTPLIITYFKLMKQVRSSRNQWSRNLSKQGEQAVNIFKPTTNKFSYMEVWDSIILGFLLHRGKEFQNYLFVHRFKNNIDLGQIFLAYLYSGFWLKMQGPAKFPLISRILLDTGSTVQQFSATCLSL